MATGRWRATAAAALFAVLAACSGGSQGDAVDVGDDASVVHDEWGRAFDEADVTGTFAARRVGTSETHVWDEARATEPRLPASTFKILNSLVVLQTGVIDDVDTVVSWDGVRREVPEWNRDHSLRSGIEVSAVWMYQALAREVGEDRMAEAVLAAGYGNGDIGGGVDEFWLRGDLRVSPIEQLEFLERMVTGELPFDAEVVTTVRDIIVRERCDGWSWSHKTGTALADDPVLGWLVGTTEWDGDEWVFAMNLDLTGADLAGQIDPMVRQVVARRLLVELGALPATHC